MEAMEAMEHLLPIPPGPILPPAMREIHDRLDRRRNCDIPHRMSPPGFNTVKPSHQLVSHRLLAIGYWLLAAGFNTIMPTSDTVPASFPSLPFVKKNLPTPLGTSKCPRQFHDLLKTTSQASPLVSATHCTPTYSTKSAAHPLLPSP